VSQGTFASELQIPQSLRQQPVRPSLFQVQPEGKHQAFQLLTLTRDSNTPERKLQYNSSTGCQRQESGSILWLSGWHWMPRFSLGYLYSIAERFWCKTEIRSRGKLLAMFLVVLLTPPVQVVHHRDGTPRRPGLEESVSRLVKAAVDDALALARRVSRPGEHWRRLKVPLPFGRERRRK
jgi:hypothetical protein